MVGNTLQNSSPAYMVLPAHKAPCAGNGWEVSQVAAATSTYPAEYLP